MTGSMRGDVGDGTASMSSLAARSSKERDEMPDEDGRERGFSFKQEVRSEGQVGFKRNAILGETKSSAKERRSSMGHSISANERVEQ